jgi:hypothetical protein
VVDSKFFLPHASPVGAGLLAIAVYQPAEMLDVMPQSPEAGSYRFSNVAMPCRQLFEVVTAALAQLQKTTNKQIKPMG